MSASIFSTDAIDAIQPEEQALKSSYVDADKASTNLEQADSKSALWCGSRRGSVMHSVASFGSLHSRQSSASMNSQGSRKGRRQWPSASSLPAQRSQHKEKPWKCSFCTASFETRYSWNRHEESVHVHRKIWVCGGKDACPAEDWANDSSCRYCGGTASYNHMTMHQHFSCAHAAESERTFFRKDNLMQHLRSTHHVGKGYLKRMKDTISYWKTESPLPSESPLLMCPVCDKMSTDWKSRVNHVATHFSQQRSKSNRDFVGSLIRQTDTSSKVKETVQPARKKNSMFILGDSSSDEDESCRDDSSLFPTSSLSDALLDHVSAHKVICYDGEDPARSQQFNGEMTMEGSDEGVEKMGIPSLVRHHGYGRFHS